MRWGSVLVNLTISLVVRCIVGLLVLFSLKVSKLDGRYLDVLLHRINRNKILLFPILPLAVPILWSNRFSRRDPKIYWRRPLVELYRGFVFAINLIRIRFGLRRCYYFTAVFRKMCYAWLSCYHFLCCLKVLLFSFDPIPIEFFSVVVSFGRFFLKAWAGILHYVVLLRGLISALYLMSVVLVGKSFLSFLCSVLFRVRLLRVPANCFFTESSDFFWLALYPASWTFSSIVNNSFRCFPLAPLFTLIESSSHTGVWFGCSMFCLFFLEI